MNIIADKIVSGGNCIGKINGKTVFISDILPGETAKIQITESKKDYDNAITIAIENPSPHRISPKCPYYGKCGGCNLQIATDEYQRILRKSIFQDCLQRSLGRNFDVTTLPEIEIIYGKSWEYRSRFQFCGKGLKEKNGNKIIPLNDCPIATPKIRELLKNNKIPNTNDRINVFEDSICTTPNLLVEKTLSILDKQIIFPVNGFFQSNIEMLEKTIPLIMKDLTGKRLLDMYSGVGTFSIFASSLFQHTTLVEFNQLSLSYATKNLTNIEFDTFAMTGAKWTKTKSANQKYDALIIDPPRTGIEKEVIEWITKNKPQIIRSVSCDPVTHSRDTKKLLEAGYVIEKIYLLDFYPQTNHIESLICFNYKG